MKKGLMVREQWLRVLVQMEIKKKEKNIVAIARLTEDL